jgi:hypothetical protein
MLTVDQINTKDELTRLFFALDAYPQVTKKQPVNQITITKLMDRVATILDRLNQPGRRMQNGLYVLYGRDGF